MQALNGSSAYRGFATIAGFLAAAIAGFIGLIVALAIAASVVVIGFFGGILLAFVGIALRALRTSKPAPAADPDIIEAKRVGGHSWVAYGWDNQR